MKIAIVATRNMAMSPARATSIDLCIRDFVRFSAHRDSTRIFARPVAEPFDDLDLCFVDGSGYRALARNTADAIRRFGADLVVVHQHLPTAALLARKLAPLPVLYHSHNFEKPPGGMVQRWRHRRRYRRLAGLIFVSNACREAYLADWPLISRPTYVVPNGLDFSAWHPAVERENIIFYAGRLEPVKRLVEAAEALGPVLCKHPEWRAVFYLVNPDALPAYRDQVLQQLRTLGDQVTIAYDQPHEAVKAMLERSLVAFMPSKRESFGRFALEAHAGGAALISSGAGALAEVSGELALYPSHETVEGYAAALNRIIEDTELCRRLAVKGRDRAAAEFDIRRSAEHLDHVYGETLAQSHA